MRTFAQLAIVAAVATATSALAQSRRVFVNGEHRSDSQVMRRSRIQCSFIPNGHHWVDWRSGVWGLTGNPRQFGLLGHACYAGRGTQRVPSLSECGLLYRPGEIINGR